MKKIFALFLLLSFALQTFSQCITVADFYIHRSSIAANQCVNRYRPMLHCNGKCQLAKKLKQQDRNDQQNPERKMNGKEEVSSSKSFFAAAPPKIISALPVYNLFQLSHVADRSIPVFRPPSHL